MVPVVLLVVQDAIFADNLLKNLEPLNVSIMIGANRQEAICICLSHTVDVVLLDVRWFGKEAIQTLVGVKKIQPQAEVVMLSSPGDVALAMEGMREGASDEITVPLDVESLREKVGEALARKNVLGKTGWRHSILNIFENTMIAATFAQAGEFDSAREIIEQRDRKNKK